MGLSIAKAATASLFAAGVVFGPAASAFAATPPVAIRVPTVSEMEIQAVNSLSGAQLTSLDRAVDVVEALQPGAFEGRLDAFDDRVDFRAERLVELGG